MIALISNLLSALNIDFIGLAHTQKKKKGDRDSRAVKTAFWI